MDKKSIAIVTGANSGMGKVASLEIAKTGANVVMLCRSRERGEKAVNEVRAISGNDSVELMLCDLGSRKSIEEFCSEFKKRYSRLDVLVNNAGVMLPKRRETVDGYELQFGVNYLGHFLLTNLLLDVLIASAPSRIVNTSSMAHKSGKIHFEDINLKKRFSSFRAYSQSKLANILFTYELAERLKGTGVTVNCLHPGVVATGIGADRDKGTASFSNRAMSMLFKSPEKGAETAVYLATSPEVEGVTGKYFCNKRTIPSSKSSYNISDRKRLWDLSEEMTGLKNNCPWGMIL
jgi:NAD(P)-dependent dehydrogenase (short-subunit alcohol dehydrogenase family)